MRVKQTLLHVGVALVASVLALMIASCALQPVPPHEPSYPRVGTVTDLPQGRIRATGVVGQYPLSTPGTTTAEWVLYSSLGTTSAPISVVGSLVGHGPAQQFATLDGKVVTVEGKLSPPVVSHFVSSPWPRLEVTSYSVAPTSVQAAVRRSGALVQPGRWFDTPPKLAIARVFEEARHATYRDLGSARQAFAGRIPEVHSSLVGHLIGVSLPPGPRAWYEFYSAGITVAGPFHAKDGPGWVVSEYTAERGTAKVHLIRVNGQPALFHANGMNASLWFWDGQAAISISGSGLSESDLVAIAQSLSW
jgi:hypothetical protein